MVEDTATAAGVFSCWPTSAVARSSVPSHRNDNPPVITARPPSSNVPFSLSCGVRNAPLIARTAAVVLHEAGLPTQALPPGVGICGRGNLCFAFNYGAAPQPIPCGSAELLIGSGKLESGGVAALLECSTPGQGNGRVD